MDDQPNLSLPRVLKDLFTIMLFRFKPFGRIWVAWLIGVNMVALAFIQYPEGQLSMLTTMAGLAMMASIYANMRFVRLMGVGHLLWVPMMVWMWLRLSKGLIEPEALGIWVIVLVSTNALSLVLDAVDIFRYFRGERDPYFSV